MLVSLHYALCPTSTLMDGMLMFSFPPPCSPTSTARPRVRSSVSRDVILKRVVECDDRS